MPGQEDEHYAGKSETRGRPLCPFCGSVNVYPIKAKYLIIFKKTISWSCANESCRMYRKQFPSPSWGSGRGHR
jgi:hypothetical protein